MTTNLKESRSPQLCATCRNHGLTVLKTGHKLCPYDEDHFDATGAICKMCAVTKQRRVSGAAEIKRKRGQPVDQNFQPQMQGKQRRAKECRKCRHHEKSGVKLSGGHRNICPHKDCLCDICLDIDKLRFTVRVENIDKRQNGGFSNREEKVQPLDEGYSTSEEVSQSSPSQAKIPDVDLFEIIEHDFNHDSFKDSLQIYLQINFSD
jgi:hypothetical protein